MFIFSAEMLQKIFNLKSMIDGTIGLGVYPGIILIGMAATRLGTSIEGILSKDVQRNPLWDKGINVLDPCIQRIIEQKSVGRADFQNVEIAQGDRVTFLELLARLKVRAPLTGVPERPLIGRRFEIEDIGLCASILQIFQMNFFHKLAQLSHQDLRSRFVC